MSARGVARSLAPGAGEPASVVLPAPDAELRYWPAWLEPSLADDALAELERGCDWRQHEVRIAGRVLPCPRLSAWHGDPDAVYGYSGRRYTPSPWTPVLMDLRERVERTTGGCFNSVLANLYRDGRDSMGFHSDDEPELGREPLIAAVSLGAVRRFVLRHRRRKDLAPVVVEPAHGSLLVMAGATQHHWRHALPKTRQPVGRRVSLTYRLIHAGPGD